MEQPLEFGTKEEGHSITGWPKVGQCACGARSVMCVATHDLATYECRGTPVDPHSDYGPDGCGKVYEVKREGA